MAHNGKKHTRYSTIERRRGSNRVPATKQVIRTTNIIWYLPHRRHAIPKSVSSHSTKLYKVHTGLHMLLEILEEEQEIGRPQQADVILADYSIKTVRYTVLNKTRHSIRAEVQGEDVHIDIHTRTITCPERKHRIGELGRE